MALSPASLTKPRSHIVQPAMELEPVALNLPATHPRHSFVIASSCMYFPGPQNSHLEAPSLLKPVPHDVQESTEPVL